MNIAWKGGKQREKESSLDPNATESIRVIPISPPL